jgi:hypothetical protein
LTGQPVKIPFFKPKSWSGLRGGRPRKTMPGVFSWDEVARKNTRNIKLGNLEVLDF